MRKNYQKTPKKVFKEKLQPIIDAATLDCYDEYECRLGFAASIEDHLTFPFSANVVGETVEVIDIDQKNDTIVAVCKRKGKIYTVDVLNLDITDQIKGHEWIEAYRLWSGGYD